MLPDKHFKAFHNFKAGKPSLLILYISIPADFGVLEVVNCSLIKRLNLPGCLTFVLLFFVDC